MLEQCNGTSTRGKIPWKLEEGNGIFWYGQRLKFIGWDKIKFYIYPTQGKFIINLRHVGLFTEDYHKSKQENVFMSIRISISGQDIA